MHKWIWPPKFIFAKLFSSMGLSGATFSVHFGCPKPPLRALGEAFVCLSARREGVLDMLGLKEACQGQVGLICGVILELILE